MYNERKVKKLGMDEITKTWGEWETSYRDQGSL